MLDTALSLAVAWAAGAVAMLWAIVTVMPAVQRHAAPSQRPRRFFKTALIMAALWPITLASCIQMFAAKNRKDHK